jgi:hypothetical protein
MGPAPQHGSGHLSWDQVARQAVTILDCDFCAHHADDGMPQPFWVGEAYQPGGLVLVARNPASNKELPATAKRLLEELRRDRSQAAFIAWSRWRIAHMTSTPWTQWQRAFDERLPASPPRSSSRGSTSSPSAPMTTPPQATRCWPTDAPSTWHRRWRYYDHAP